MAFVYGTTVPEFPASLLAECPYAIIVGISGTHFAALTNSVHVYVPANLAENGLEKYSSLDTGYRSFIHMSNSSEWIADGEVENERSEVLLQNAELLWSNHDILTAAAVNDDGSYEIGTTICHKSDLNYRLTDGWLKDIGNQARRLGSVTEGLTTEEIETIMKGVSVEGSVPSAEGVEF